MGTYKYATAALTPAATCTDILTLSGGSGKVVKVKEIKVFGVATANELYVINIIKRTVANTGGTATNPTPSKDDSLYGATASGALTVYTANPATLGSGIAVDTGVILLSAATTPTIASTTFNSHNLDDVTLRSANDVLAINLAGAAVPTGAVLYVAISWAEE